MNLEQAPWCTPDWWVSHYNFDDQVRGEFQFPERVQIHDATLRDGEQTPGVVFQIEEKVAIAKALDGAGVDRIEAGMPAVSPDDFEAIRRIVKQGLKSKVMAFSRAVLSDIDKAIDAGVWGVVIEVPSGYPRLKYQFEWTPEQVLERSIQAVRYAKAKGLYVVFFPYDTTRADLDVLRQIIGGVVEKADPDAITVVDTLGSALPESVRYLVREMKKIAGGRPIEIHTHNDFGLGVATSLAAVAAGAEVVHVSVNALGERTGNAPLEETAASLQVLYQLPMNIRLDKLVPLSRLVEELSCVPVAKNKPIVGEITFSRETGAGIDMLTKHPTVVLPIHPRVYGREVSMRLGKKSGRDSIRIKLDSLNRTATDAQLQEILDQVKRKAITKKSYLSDNEFLAIANQVLK